MKISHELTYPPINTLKRVTDDLWIVDGPMIQFGPPGLKLPFSTRMTIARLDGGSLFIHSPTPLTPPLRAEVEAIGTPRFVIGPNRIHYWWIPEWRAAYPHAAIYLAPRIKEQSASRIGFVFNELGQNDGYPWDDEIDTLAVQVGFYMTEFEFFHRSSRTLILTDLMMNFETEKLPSPWLRGLIRLVGTAAPNGGMGVDMRMMFWRSRAQLRSAIETMVDWDPERIVLAHGKWFERNGADELRRAFHWLLK